MQEGHGGSRCYTANRMEFRGENAVRVCTHCLDAQGIMICKTNGAKTHAWFPQAPRARLVDILRDQRRRSVRNVLCMKKLWPENFMNENEICMYENNFHA